MIKELPLSLLQAARNTISKHKVLESCVSCGCVIGSCVHTDGLREDAITAQNLPSEDEPEKELSGKQEEIELNPEYKTFTARRP